MLDHFLPRHTNGHRAKFLRINGILLLILFSVFSQIAIYVADSSGGSILGYAANIPVSEVISLTNQKRAEMGLNQLSVNSDLSAAARAKGEHMLQYDYWAHVAPDGTEPWKFFCDHNYCDYRYAGENLARDFSNANAAIEAWLASPSHRENMLSDKYTEIGIAVVEGDLAGQDTTLIVQLFGTKLSGGPVTPTQSQLAGVTQEQDVSPTLTPIPTVSPVNTAQPTVSPSAVPQPTQTPTLTPQPTSQAIVAALPSSAPTEFIALENSNQEVLVSPFNVRRTLSLSVGALFLVVLIFDAVFIKQRNVRRNVGRTFAHFSYLLMILILVLILNSGNIL